MAKKNTMFLDWIAYALVIVGAIVWGLIGFFEYNLVESIFPAAASRWIYGAVGVSGIYSLFRAFMGK